jgi:imidazolonepropionase-like amidohydrolase
MATLTPITVALGLSLASGALGQDLVHKAPAQAKPVAIINAMIHPISSPTVPHGVVLFTDGVITDVIQLKGAEPFPKIGEQYTIIDGAGKHVYPGLIAPYTQLGLTEINAVRATLDMSETGAATPEVRAVVAVNPDSTLIPVTRSNGVLLAAVFPQTSFSGQIAYFEGPGGFMPGRAGVIRLDGWTWEQMAVTDDAGLVLNWPQARPIVAWWMDKSEADQQKEIDKNLKQIEDMFAGAKAYAMERPANVPPVEASFLPVDIRYEAMRGVFASSNKDAQPAKPVYVMANDEDQIRQAVALGERHGLRIVIVGGMDAPNVAELLKRTNTPVIIGGTMRFPKRDDSAYDEAYTLAARLEAAGVTWCMASGEEAAHERNLPYAAAMSVAYGLDHEAGLRSITLSAAKILGIAEKYGSLEKGKSATLFIADGDILEVATNVENAFIDGRTIDLNDKQKALAEKYREKYKQEKK